jgi:soluble lytic murein transglycosylase
VEYALAAYNAGTDRVEAWLANGKYRDAAEFVESIPFTETREYVQAVLRNATVYRQLYGTP